MCKSGKKHSYQLKPVKIVIDSHMHIMSAHTLPLPLIWQQSIVVRGRKGEKKRADIDALAESWIGRKLKGDLGALQKQNTRLIGRDGVLDNCETYKSSEVFKDYADKDKALLNLMIAMPMDTDYAHINGYEGESIYTKRGVGENKNRYYYYKRKSMSEGEYRLLDEEEIEMFETWAKQVKYTLLAAYDQPWNIIPMYHFEPRRWQGKESIDKNYWKKPFDYTVAASDKGLFIGFKMYTALGYKPLDPRLPELKNYYQECIKHDIPMLTHCSPTGMTSHDIKYYLGEEDNATKETQEYKNFLKANTNPELPPKYEEYKKATDESDKALIKYENELAKAEPLLKESNFENKDFIANYDAYIDADGKPGRDMQKQAEVHFKKAWGHFKKVEAAEKKYNKFMDKANAVLEDYKKAFERAENARKEYLEILDKTDTVTTKYKEARQAADELYEKYLEARDVTNQSYQSYMDAISAVEANPRNRALVKNKKRLKKQYERNEKMAVKALGKYKTAHQDADKFRIDFHKNKVAVKYFNRYFVHPKSWLEVYKQPGNTNLRLCLAHFGGYPMWEKGKYHSDWVKTIIDMAKEYPNFYTDISNFYWGRARWGKDKKTFKKIIIANPHLKKKILFGTDWYMTKLNKVQYKEYCEKSKKVLDEISEEISTDPSCKEDLWQRFAVINPLRYYRLKDHADKITKALKSGITANDEIKDKELKKLLAEGRGAIFKRMVEEVEKQEQKLNETYP